MSAMERLDRRIADAPAREAAELTLVRQELMRQNDVRDDNAHRRTLEKRNFYARVGLSCAALGAGVGLVVAGFGLPAFVCLGAGLYTIAPEFITKVTNRVVGGTEHEQR